MKPRHHIFDFERVNQIKDSMKKHGWSGPPLVWWKDLELINGTHRYQAANELGISIPFISLMEIFQEAKIDFLSAFLKKKTK